MIKAKKYFYSNKINIRGNVKTTTERLEKALEIAYLEGIIDGQPDNTGIITLECEGQLIDTSLNSIFDKLYNLLDDD